MRFLKWVTFSSCLWWHSFVFCPCPKAIRSTITLSTAPHGWISATRTLGACYEKITPHKSVHLSNTKYHVHVWFVADRKPSFLHHISLLAFWPRPKIYCCSLNGTAALNALTVMTQMMHLASRIWLRSFCWLWLKVWNWVPFMTFFFVFSFICCQSFISRREVTFSTWCCLFFSFWRNSPSWFPCYWLEGLL